MHGDGQALEIDADVYSESVIVRDVQTVMKRQIHEDLLKSKGATTALLSFDARLWRRPDFQALCDRRRDEKKRGRVLTGGWLLAEQDNQRLQKANNRFQLGSVSQRSGEAISTKWRVDDEYVFEPFSRGFLTEIPLHTGMVLRMPDGLSQYMVTLGIAKTFKYFGAWSETWMPDRPATVSSGASVPQGSQVGAH